MLPATLMKRDACLRLFAQLVTAGCANLRRHLHLLCRWQYIASAALFISRHDACFCTRHVAVTAWYEYLHCLLLPV